MKEKIVKYLVNIDLVKAWVMWCLFLLFNSIYTFLFVVTNIDVSKLNIILTVAIMSVATSSVVYSIGYDIYNALKNAKKLEQHKLRVSKYKSNNERKKVFITELKMVHELREFLVKDLGTSVSITLTPKDIEFSSNGKVIMTLIHIPEYESVEDNGIVFLVENQDLFKKVSGELKLHMHSMLWKEVFYAEKTN